LALAAAGGVVASWARSARASSGFFLPLRDLPDWVFLGPPTSAYRDRSLAAPRDWCDRAVWEFVGFIAKAILIATQ